MPLHSKTRAQKESGLVSALPNKSNILPINVFLLNIGIFQVKLEAFGVRDLNDDLTSALERHILQRRFASAFVQPTSRG